MSDFVTLHVPATPQTQWMIGPDELAAAMNLGSYLLTPVAARRADRCVVSGATQRSAWRAQRRRSSRRARRKHRLVCDGACGLPNVILTPHIGGSTQEAMPASVAKSPRASASSSPKVPPQARSTFRRSSCLRRAALHRILNVHKNVPGVLRDISRVVSELNANIHSQMLSTDEKHRLLDHLDLDQDFSAQVRDGISGLPTSIRTRIL